MQIEDSFFKSYTKKGFCLLVTSSDNDVYLRVHKTHINFDSYTSNGSQSNLFFLRRQSNVTRFIIIVYSSNYSMSIGIFYVK